MSRTPKFPQFRAALHKRFPERECQRVQRHGAQVLDFGDVQLYVRTNISDDPAWWGLTKNIYKRLQKSGRAWYCVLLLGDGEEGYLLHSSQWVGNPGSSENAISYILHENRDTEDEKRFRSFEEVFSLLNL